MSTPSQTLRVMTLNTWGFRWPLARHRKRRFQRIVAHLDAHPYDVVGLQELWDHADAHIDAERVGWHPGAQRLRGKRRLDSGLGVKLRAGIRDRAVALLDAIRAYRHHRGWDRLKRKGLLGLSMPLDHGLGDVVVLTTHFQAGPRKGRIRRTQLEDLIRVVDQITAPIILMGDFNFYEGSPEDRAAHAELIALGFQDVAETLDRPEPTYLSANPYSGRFDRDERFDRVYVRDGLRVSLVGEDVRVHVDHEQPMSDHQPLIATLRACPI